METQTNHQATRTNQNFQVNGDVLAPPNPDRHIYACPIPAIKMPPQPSFASQQQRNSAGEGGFTPTKHVSFQDPPAQHRQRPKKDREQGSDLWRSREARAELERQKQLCELELLEQEVQRLRVKEERTLEENDRLRRLSLEWQFQKRLQEMEKRGDDEEEDEDLEAMLMIRQLEIRTQARFYKIMHLNKKKSMIVYRK